MDELIQLSAPGYTSTSEDANLTQSVSKTFTNWSPNPWVITNSNGTPLAAISNMNLTLIKSTDTTTKAITVTANLFFYQTSNGYTTGPAGIALAILFFDSNKGLIFEWDFNRRNIINCTDVNFYEYYATSLNSTYYDLTLYATLTQTSGISFSQCT